MTTPGGGGDRLEVGVTIDATGVEKEAQAKIDAATAKVRAKIQADIDFRRLKAQAEAVSKRIGKTTEIKLQLGVDPKHLLASLDAAVKEANARNYAVHVKVEVDKKQLDEALSGKGKTVTVRRQLVAPSGGGDEKVTVDADTAPAEAKVSRWRNMLRRPEKAQVDADTTAAEAQVEEFRRKASGEVIDVPVEIDQESLRKGGRGVRAFTQNMSGLQKVGFYGGLLQTLASAAVSAGGGLYAMAGAASQASGILLALPAAATMAAQGIGALFIGMSGISDVVGLMGKAQAQAGRTAAQSAHAQQQAARRIAQARDQVTKTAESGAKRIASAEKAVADSQGRSVTAQKALNRARKDAADALENYQLQLSGAALDEESATLAIERARNAWNDAMRNPASTALDRKEADLNLRQAEQSLAEIQDRNKDLRNEASDAEKNGVEGAANVVSAKQDVVDAAQNEKDAEAELADARKQAAADNKDAQQNLADAIQSAADAMDKQSSSAAMLQSAMDKLSPKAQEFARYWHEVITPRLGEFKKAVQEKVVPGVFDAVKALTTDIDPKHGLPAFLDVIQTGMKNSGTIMGNFVRNLGTMMSSEPFKADVATIMDNNNVALSSFTSAGEHLVSILKDLALAAGPMLKDFADHVNTWLATKDAVLGTNTGMDKLSGFLGRAWSRAKQLWNIGSDLVGILVGIGHAGSESGDSLLTTLGKWLDEWHKWIDSDEGQKRLKQFFDTVQPLFEDLAGLIGDIAGALTSMGEDGSGALGDIVWFLDKLIKGFRWLMESPFGPVIGYLLQFGVVASLLALATKRLSKFTSGFKLLGKIAGGIGRGVGAIFGGAKKRRAARAAKNGSGGGDGGDTATAAVQRSAGARSRAETRANKIRQEVYWTHSMPVYLTEGAVGGKSGGKGGGKDCGGCGGCGGKGGGKSGGKGACGDGTVRRKGALPPVPAPGDPGGVMSRSGGNKRQTVKRRGRLGRVADGIRGRWAQVNSAENRERGSIRLGTRPDTDPTASLMAGNRAGIARHTARRRAAIEDIDSRRPRGRSRVRRAGGTVKRGGRAVKRAGGAAIGVGGALAGSMGGGGSDVTASNGDVVGGLGGKVAGWGASVKKATDLASKYVGGWAGDALKKVGGWAGGASKFVADWSSSGVGKAVSTAGGFITTFAADNLDTVKTWASNAASKVGEWASSAASTAGRWATGIGTGLSTAATTVGGWATNAGTAVAGWASSAKTTASAWASNITSGLSGAGSKISTWASTAAGKLGTVTSAVGDVVTAFGKSIKKAGEAAIAWAATSARKTWDAFVSVAGAVSDVASAFGRSAVKAGEAAAAWIILNAAKVAGALADGALAIAEGIAAAATWALDAAIWANPITWLVALIIGLIAVFILLVTNAWGLRDKLVAAFKWIKDKVWEAVSWLTSKVVAAFKWVKDKVVTAAEWVRDKVVNAFEWARDKAVAAFNWVKDKVGGIWDSIKSILRKPLQGVIDVIYNNGIRKVYNWMNNLWNGDDLPAYTLPQFAKGGVDTRRGGTAKGYAPGKDTLLAKVSPGEGFLVPEAVRGLASAMGTSAAGAIQAINSEFSSRVRGPGLAFATGGVLGKGRRASWLDAENADQARRMSWIKGIRSEGTGISDRATKNKLDYQHQIGSLDARRKLLAKQLQKAKRTKTRRDDIGIYKQIAELSRTRSKATFDYQRQGRIGELRHRRLTSRTLAGVPRGVDKKHLPQFGLGGVFSSIGHGVGNAWNAASGWVGDKWDDLSDLVAQGWKIAANAAVKPIRAGINAAIPGKGSLSTGLRSGANNWIDKLLDTVGAKEKANGAGDGKLGSNWQSIATIVQKAIPQARINSTYRPGDPGYHGKNKAVDFGFGGVPGGNGSAGLASIASFLYRNFGKTLAELIYDGIGDNTPDVKNGRDHTYDATTSGQHHNHVHAAVYDRGGRMRSKSVGLNLSRHDEGVLTGGPGGGIEALGGWGRLDSLNRGVPLAQLVATSGGAIDRTTGGGNVGVLIQEGAVKQYITNPAPETASGTLNSGLRRVAATGIFGDGPVR